MALRKPGISRLVRIVVAAAATCLGGILIWYVAANDVPQGRSMLLTFGFVALVWVLFRVRVLQEPRGYSVPFFGKTPSLRDVLKSVACYVGGVAWVALLARHVSDTEAGGLLILGPSLLLVVLGTFFLIRGLLRAANR